jgi:hypothetical protein
LLKFKKIRSYMTEFEAEQAKNLLEASGIDAFVEGANTQTTLSYIGLAVGGVKLLVSEQDELRAIEALDAIHSTSAGPWTCSRCYSEVDAGFDVCWNCGGLREDAALMEELAAPDSQQASPEAFTVRDVDRPPDSHLSSNPFQTPASNQLVVADPADQQRDALLDRAWRASVIGTAVLPGIAHIYSLVLLAAAFTKPSSRGVTLRVFLTLVIDLVVLAILATWIRSSLFH